MSGESSVDRQQLTLVASVGGRSYAGCEASGKCLQCQPKVWSFFSYDPVIFNRDFLGRNLFVNLPCDALMKPFT